MGEHLGLARKQQPAEMGLVKEPSQELPGQVIQQADNYSEVKMENFRRLAMMHEPVGPSHDGTEERDKPSPWDKVRKSVTYAQNRKFLSMLFDLDHEDDEDPETRTRRVELATEHPLAINDLPAE
jgi:hypothetical protein